MPDNFNSNTKNNGEWLTPKYITNFFEFDLDPCSPVIRPWDTAKNHFNEKDDGLSKDWNGFVFCNPPYGRELPKWIAKGYEEWQKGKTVVFLIPSRTDTRWWHDYCMKATEIRYIKGRLKFDDQPNPAPFPSAIVIFK